jgi:hypothetical protein
MACVCQVAWRLARFGEGLQSERTAASGFERHSAAGVQAAEVQCANVTAVRSDELETFRSGGLFG